MINTLLVSQGLIFMPIIISVLIYMFSSKKLNYIVFIGQGFVTILAVFMWKEVLDNGIVYILLGGWDRSIGIELCIDNLSMLFMSMAVVIWWVVLLYSWDNKKHDFKFLFFLMFLEGSFLAFVQVNDFFTMFVLIEILTIISSILIIYKKDGISVKAGLYYLLFNSFGMLMYLLGLALLYLKVGSLNMTMVSEFIAQTEPMSQSYSIIKVSYVCFFVAMCVKAALFPVYEWLPRAHTAAPAQISALLSGLLVKTGLFGLIRILFIFNYDNIYPFLFYLGFFTSISGIFFAVSQKDIKAILAFHTISQIGLMIMSIAANTDIGWVGAYVHILNHFLFKSLLFLGAGIIINEYGIRKVTDIRGIGKNHPVFTTFMFIGIFAITGAPMSIGFLSKSIMKVSMSTDLNYWLFQLVSLGTMVSFVKFSTMFFGESKVVKHLKGGQLFAIGILAVLCVVGFLGELKVVPAFLAINNKTTSYELVTLIKTVQKASYSFRYYLDYLLMLSVAFTIYKLIVEKELKLLHDLRHFEMKFQDAIISLMVFFVLVISVIG